MTDEFEEKLRRALRPRQPGAGFTERVVSSLDSSGTGPRSVARLDSKRRRGFRYRWLSAALAACLIAGVGLVQLRRHALDAARASHARAQLLQALSIASDNVNIVRSAVAHEENPDS